MVDSLNGQSPPGQATYTDQVARLIWREKMLGQILDKLRVAAPNMDTAQTLLPAHPTKGGLVDIYV